jgi:molybdopterin converting factor small subunit
MIRIELYEMARHLAGIAHVDVEAATLEDALAALRAAHPQLEPDVLRGNRLAPTWRVSLGGGRWLEDPLTPLSSGEVLVLVSALAGG